MITAIFLPFLMREWKYILIIVLIGGLYTLIYNHGYHSCQEDVAIAKLKATEEAQIIAGQEKQKILDDNKKEIQKHLTLEKELTNELNKKIYTNCAVTADGVRIINKFAK